MACLGLGALYIQAGEVREARRYLERVTELASQVGNQAVEVLAKQMMSQTLVDPAESLDSLKDSVLRAREAGFTEVEMVGQMFLGLQYLRLCRSEEATAVLTAVLDLAKKGGVRVLQSTGITGLAGLSILEGQLQEAISGLESSSTLLDSVQDEIVSEEHLVSWSELPSAVNTLLVYTLVKQGSPERAFEYSEKARAIAFLRQIGRARAQPGKIPADLLARRDAILRRIQSLSRQLEAEGTTPGEAVSGHVDDLRKSLNASRDEYNLLRLEIRERLPEHAALGSTETVDCSQIQAALPPDVTLISYFTGFQPGSAALAWVVDHDELHMVSLEVSSARLQQQVRHLTDVIRGRGFDFEKADELYRELIAPLEPFIHHRNIILVPHGALHELPFAALWSAERGRFLIEDFSLVQAPSANALRFLAGEQSPNRGRILVMGDPDGSLPHAREEADAIARLFGERAWVGPAATESRSRRRETEIDVLHLAAHASYDPRNPRFSYVNLAPDEENDGRLELREVYELDLTGTNLVVLSGCDTGFAERTSADDLTGMTPAFLFAGSPAVITSLWYVDDASSAALMKRFYQNLLSSSSTAEALRQAQLEISNREQWRSPYYWAAFVLTGDAAWSPPGERSP